MTGPTEWLELDHTNEILHSIPSFYHGAVKVIICYVSAKWDT